MNDIEKKFSEKISPLVEFLGIERIEDMKDKIAQAFVDRVIEDLEESGGYFLIYPDYFKDIAEDAAISCERKIKKMFRDKYIEIATNAVEQYMPHNGDD